MKLLPAAATLICAALLAGCGPKQTDADIERQVQERLAEEHTAQQERALHEKEAALDERERVVHEQEQRAAATPAPEADAETPQPGPSIASAPADGANGPTSANASYQAFYDDLTPFGSWIAMSGYGYVWQPSDSIQNDRWRPYTIGHWSFTDAGWTWMSDEPFGWITYHYGRWMQTHQLGWVWVPGEQWAPAWVSWRYGGDYVGWAALPPEAQLDGVNGIQQWADDHYNLGAGDYTFVPASDFGEGSMASVAIPPDDNTPIYDESTNITNIYYDTAAYTVFCYGPNFDFMRSKSHRRLPDPFHLVRDGFRSNGWNGAVISGNTLRITAPRIAPPASGSAPRSVRGRVSDSRLVTAPSHTGSVPPTSGPPGTGMHVPSGLHGTPLTPQQAQALQNQQQGGNSAPGMHVPSQLNPNPIRQPDVPGATVQQPPGPGAGRGTQQGNPNQPRQNNPSSDANPATGMRIPSQMKPVTVPSDIQAQKAHDLQIIEQRRAADLQNQQREDQANARAAQKAAQQAAAQEAAQQRATQQQAARQEQTAQQQAARNAALATQATAAQAAQAARAAQDSIRQSQSAQPLASPGTGRLQ